MLILIYKTKIYSEEPAYSVKNLITSPHDKEHPMKLFLYLSDFIVPFLILAIIVYGILMGTNVYDNFIKGARSGFLTVIKIMPTLIGLMVAVGILRASGFLEFFARLIGKITLYIGFPGELVL